MKGKKDNIVLIGGSAGSLLLITEILENLPARLDYALCIIIHRSSTFSSEIEKSLSIKLNRPVIAITDKTPIKNGIIYFAPPGYHILIDPPGTFALDSSEHVNYAKPSIDVLFESCAQIYGQYCTAFLLSGANADGARGLKAIEEFGGKTFIQNPSDALIETMPISGIQESRLSTILKNQDIIRYFSDNLQLS
ncbi:chemotaxis protein CheB [Sphingobacterium faecale]|uniref:protein-glutamate methylesterase n=1 Tax=Sphingobacterium faecale TaxID=2803775 RepID=A0ABS1RBU8_9SPHI|nr:chemotaxis protein CheB [Sphingobacterium faecale]MBL1411326.1 chemotaxis protein CheB [Sphingobacterium faecale]